MELLLCPGHLPIYAIYDIYSGADDLLLYSLNFPIAEVL